MSRTSALVLATRLAGAALALAVTPTVSPARQAAPPAIDWMSRLAPGALLGKFEAIFWAAASQYPAVLREHGLG